ncbi:hypothetical protein [Marinobacter salsuginis]|uniref:hypothetical protein n=1 Tax=Marinobacter salsuginis TaxID=418719 RepID=UPI001AE0BC4C|nr:hypothetical protein [Marinobacter salsuginis]QTN40941.1 hypothetical protein HZ997_14780 [Marinobacter salsuginis]
MSSDNVKDQEQKALDEATQLATRLLGTSVDDASTTLINQAEIRPACLLVDVAMVLTIMNKEGIEKKSHRQAMARAARAAIKNLVEVPSHG